MKVILNKCYGGFGISPMAYKLYAEKKGIELYPYVEDNSNYSSKGETIYHKVDWTDKRINRILIVHYFTKDLGESIIENKNNKSEFNEIYKNYSLYIKGNYRTDPVLVEVVEELRGKANGNFADLVVVEIPDGMEYTIDEYDGVETLHQKVWEW